MGILDSLRRLVSDQAAEETPGRLVYETMPPAVYVIGDVHGCHRLQQEIEQKIRADARGIQGTKLIVYIGDLVDRGDQSSEVLEMCLSPPGDGFERICLLGNHELMMRDYLAAPSRNASWLRIGGLETLRSYGVTQQQIDDSRQLAMVLQTVIPENHLRFLHDRPMCLDLPDYFLVHAGIDPTKPLARQTAKDMLWTREPFLSWPEPLEKTIVHGHTPAKEVERAPHRIGIDTGAFATGKLSAIRLTPEKPPLVITASYGNRTA